MKRLFSIVCVAITMTGCASTQNTSNNTDPSIGSLIMCGYGLCNKETTQYIEEKRITSAKRDCNRIGFADNNPNFPFCVQNMVNQSRNRETAERNARRQSSTDVTCTPWLNGMRCQSF